MIIIIIIIIVMTIFSDPILEKRIRSLYSPVRKFSKVRDTQLVCILQFSGLLQPSFSLLNILFLPHFFSLDLVETYGPELFS